MRAQRRGAGGLHVLCPWCGLQQDFKVKKKLNNPPLAQVRQPVWKHFFCLHFVYLFVCLFVFFLLCGFLGMLPGTVCLAKWQPLHSPAGNILVPPHPGRAELTYTHVPLSALNFGLRGAWRREVRLNLHFSHALTFVMHRQLWKWAAVWRSSVASFGEILGEEMLPATHRGSFHG